MGIGGHMLGEKKLRRLNKITGLRLDRAYIRGSESEGRCVFGGRCFHFKINTKTGAWSPIMKPSHWTTCPKENRG